MNRSTGLRRERVVVCDVDGLIQVVRDRFCNVREVFACHQRADDQGKEDDEEDEVEDGIADDSSLAELGLLQRVNGWANLSAAEYVSTAFSR